jgi:hypothetical protein
VLLVAGGCFVVTAFFVKKGVDAVKDFAGDVESDPDLAAFKAARLAFRMNPEVEIVSSDERDKTLTVREKKTGKEVTFDLADIKAGRLTMSTDDETVSFQAKAEVGEEGASFRIETERGTTVYGASADSVPDWVPSYPGAEAGSYSSVEQGGERSGTFTIRTSDSAERVLAHFERVLREAGFEVEKSTLESATVLGGNLTATRGSRSVNVTVATQEGESQGLVAYSERP